jgi:hypothetical protein
LNHTRFEARTLYTLRIAADAHVVLTLLALLVHKYKY